MVWITFLGSAAILVLAAMKLAQYGDVIAYRTRLGGMFIGTLLLAGATSLPEFLTSINSIQQNQLNLAAGNMFGSNMFNMFMIGLLDMIFYRARILRRVALKHALTGSLGILLIGMAAFFLLAGLEWQLGWVGVDSLLLIVTYLVGVWLLRKQHTGAPAVAPEAVEPSLPSLGHALVGFGLTTAVLIFVTPWLVRSSAEIAVITGLGTGFVGTALLAMITSLPELVTTVAAARIGAYDLAVGNLFGSNLFNMFALGVTDFFYLQGRFLGALDPNFALVALLGLILTGVGLVSNQARLERRLWLVEVDALLLIVLYLAGLAFIYTRQIGL